MRKRVDDVMGLLDITDLAQRAPHELSDGQKQRVALAGVLAMQPKLVILDEPTSLLDPKTAGELVTLVANLRQELGTTFVIVEHRLDLLVRVADRMVVMSEGRKALEGTPREVLFQDRVDSFGISVPSITQVQKMLMKDGLLSQRELLTPSGLAEAVGEMQLD
jgi:energy-coupling factor transporter ATP-binding protein EcfA2